MIDRNQPGDMEIGKFIMTRHCAAQMDSPHGRDAVPARAVLIDAPLTPVSFSGASGIPPSPAIRQWLTPVRRLRSGV